MYLYYQTYFGPLLEKKESTEQENVLTNKANKGEQTPVAKRFH